MTFINLPVQDMERSKAFYRSLGLEFNEQMTNDEGACVVLNENTFLMLLIHPFYKKFIRKDIADARTSELILALSTDSREQVDELMDKALAAGATESADPQDMGFMRSRSFEDPDGHLFEVMFYDPAAAGAAESQEQQA
ncbi:glyoxalase/bleomycin resistance/extradiol dioxygenase family protein [Paenibacillus albicereus]|uniref:Glyoxalase/bleomycin resistance/extradiol dioxygenase family protein n=2 Tax=Paenibacillus albicereus TaxID=2726185 RepID=A0A6H2H399_9BACL|nr:glyoxalase/bleomycin resistance/extradiol dioxygenase family protein [Paenibacillus albicereus]